MRWKTAGASVVLFAIAAGVRGQEAPAEPQFEVASVRHQPRIGASGGVVIPGVAQPGGRWVASGVPLLQIIRSAYPEYSRGRIIGGPDWIQTDLFDIDARATGNPPPAQFRLMVRRLLADRFKLTLHTESRPADVYVLRLARADARLGPGLRRAAIDCVAVRSTRTRDETPPAPGSDAERCTQRSENGPNGTIRFRAAAFSIDGGLTTLIGGSVDRPIVDRTGLTGTFDFELEYVPPSALSVGSNAGLSLFTALEEQLGLHLEPRRENLDVLVIDRVELPTPN